MIDAAFPTTRYGLVQASYWSAFCMVVMFASAYLLDAGLTNAQIGIVVASGGALSAVLQPIVAGAADRSRRVPLRVWAAGMAAVMALLAVVLLLPDLHWLATAVFFGLLILSIQTLQPLVNALGMAAVARGMAVNFGVARALGSAVFALVSVSAGWVVATAGTVAIPSLIIVFQLLFLGAALTFVVRGEPVVVLEDLHHTGDPAPVQGLSRARWWKFGMLLAGITLSMTSHAMINSYLIQIMYHHGGDTSEMGLAIMIAAFMELPVMLLWSRIVKRWSPGRLLQVAGIFFVIKTAATWLAPSIGAIYAVQTLQLLAFALMVMSSVYYVEHLLPAADRIKGQAYMTVTATAGSVVGSLLGGMLLDISGVPAMLLAGTVLAAIGAGLTLPSAEIH